MVIAILDVQVALSIKLLLLFNELYLLLFLSLFHPCAKKVKNSHFAIFRQSLQMTTWADIPPHVHMSLVCGLF